MLEKVIPLIISVVSSLVVIISSYSVLQQKVKQHDMERNELKATLAEATKRLEVAVASVTLLSHEQNIINKFTADTMHNIVEKASKQDNRISNNESDIKLLIELVKRLEISVADLARVKKINNDA